MAILDDFTIDTTLKTIRHTSGTVVYSVNALYSAFKDFEDDPGNMTFETLMTAQTPTEYTLINGWFMDNRPSMTFLDGGAITTSGFLNEIQRIVTTDTGVNPVAGDLGRDATATGGNGPLLHFQVDINDDGTQVNSWYVRTGAGTALTGTIEVTTDGGTGTQGIDTSIDGEEVWANIFLLGSITSDPAGQFYVEQQLNGVDHRIVEWSGNSNWTRGALDVLIRVQIGGTLIDSGDLLVTLRQQGDLYDSTEVTVTGGRNPMPLNSSTDPDNAAAEWFILYDGEASGPFVVNDVIEESGTGKWYAEVVSVIDNGTEGALGLRGLNQIAGVIADNDAFLVKGGAANALVNGTEGDKVIAFDAETVSFTTLGQIITGAGGAKSILTGIQDDGTTGLLCLSIDLTDGGTIDFREDSTYYDLYIEDELITGASEGSADVDLATTNLQTGTSGLNGKIEVIWHHGEITVDGGHSLTVGMHVTQAVSLQTGTVTDVTGNVIGIGDTSADFATSANSINDDDSGGTGANPTGWVDDHTVDKAFQQGTLEPYDVVIFLENETVQRGYEWGKFVTGDAYTTTHNMYNLISASLDRTPVQGQFYLSAFIDQDTPANTYDKIGKRTAPLGTFAGGTWFTAQGIWLQDVASADATSFQLIDSDGDTNDPPNFVSVTAENTLTLDFVVLAESLGSGSTLVNKAVYNSEASNNAIDTSQFEVDGTPGIRTDTPSNGFLRVTDDSSTATQTREARYKYDSFGTVVDEFELTPFTDSTGTAGAGGLVHTNSGRDFSADGVEVGMIIRNTTSGDIGFISVVGTTTFTVKQLEGAGDGQFDTGDVITINKLVVAYVAADTAYTPYIDREADATSETETVIFSVNRFVVSKVRQAGDIFAFDGTGTLNNTGVTVTTIRNADTIAT